MDSTVVFGEELRFFGEGRGEEPGCVTEPAKRIPRGRFSHPQENSDFRRKVWNCDSMPSENPSGSASLRSLIRPTR